MTKLHKPMLAVAAGDLNQLRYPLLASQKLDGIRAIITPDGPRTRSLKEIPNTYIRRHLETLPAGLDGEIGTIGSNGAINFRETTGNVMRESGTPDFKYFVFDNYMVDETFLVRIANLEKLRAKLPDWVVILKQTHVRDAEQVKLLFEAALAEGNEGLILRDPVGVYKHGRSTLKEQGMLKCKPWEDAEAIVVDVVEEMHNTNEATKNELGRTKRSSAQDGLVGKGTMEMLLVKSERWPKPFGIGTGFDAVLRAELWKNKPVGKIVKFKYVLAGGYDVPRHTVFLGFRDERDM